MPKYINADALKEAFLFECKDVYDDTDEFDVKWGASQKLIEEVIDSAPAADVAEVVHCKDCEFKERCFRNLKFINENGSTSTGLIHWCSIGRKKDE